MKRSEMSLIRIYRRLTKERKLWSLTLMSVGLDSKISTNWLTERNWLMERNLPQMRV